jgi:hypothetical protein
MERSKLRYFFDFKNCPSNRYDFFEEGALDVKWDQRICRNSQLVVSNFSFRSASCCYIFLDAVNCRHRVLARYKFCGRAAAGSGKSADLILHRELPLLKNCTVPYDVRF